MRPYIFQLSTFENMLSMRANNTREHSHQIRNLSAELWNHFTLAFWNFFNPWALWHIPLGWLHSRESLSSIFVRYLWFSIGNDFPAVSHLFSGRKRNHCGRLTRSGLEPSDLGFLSLCSSSIDAYPEISFDFAPYEHSISYIAKPLMGNCVYCVYCV